MNGDFRELGVVGIKNLHITGSLDDIEEGVSRDIGNGYVNKIQKYC